MKLRGEASGAPPGGGGASGAARAKAPSGPHHRRSTARVRMNMLSTPMARMRKGTTSLTIMVTWRPTADASASADSTEAATITMPCTPSSERLATRCGNLPSDTTTYSSMAT